MAKKKLTMQEKINQIYERHPDYKPEVKDWNKGGFVSDEKYKQPIKHKTYGKRKIN